MISRMRCSTPAHQQTVKWEFLVYRTHSSSKARPLGCLSLGKTKPDDGGGTNAAENLERFHLLYSHISAGAEDVAAIAGGDRLQREGDRVVECCLGSRGGGP